MGGVVYKIHLQNKKKTFFKTLLDGASCSQQCERAYLWHGTSLKNVLFGFNSFCLSAHMSIQSVFVTNKPTYVCIVRCTACIVNCERCHPKDPDICQQCNAGYYLSPSKQCQGQIYTSLLTYVIFTR